VLGIAAALEAHSRHPIASAFRGLAPHTVDASDVRTQAGAGLEGRIADRCWRIGTADFASSLAGGAIPTEPPQAGNWILLADAEGPAAWFQLGDAPRREAKAALQALSTRGLTVELASGDHPQAVQALAQTLGMAPQPQRLTPEAKLDLIRQRQAQLGAVAMVGDGINDAPVLAGADVAIAMGAGSALAHACADLILLGDDLTMLPIAIDISRQTRRIIRQNLAWALAYNLLSIPLAAPAGFRPGCGDRHVGKLAAGRLQRPPHPSERGAGVRTRRAFKAGAGAVMNIIFVLIPMGLVLVIIAIAAFFWAVNHGQFDDLDTPALRILMDEDAPPPPPDRAP